MLIAKRLESFWSHSHGWAPRDAAALLASARLDRQVSFTNTLSDYLEPFPVDQAEARQILGYVTLRSLCEGVLKLFFAVYLEDYRNDSAAFRDREGNVKSPKTLTFDQLITAYSRCSNPDHEEFLRRVQARGNSIHHFVDRDIGLQAELLSDFGRFLDFLLRVDRSLPYP